MYANTFLVTCDLGILLPPHSQGAWPTPRIGSYREASLKKCVCEASWPLNHVVGCQLVIFVPVNLAILMNLKAEIAITRSPYLPLLEETTSHASPKVPLPRSFCFIWTKRCAQQFWMIYSASSSLLLGPLGWNVFITSKAVGAGRRQTRLLGRRLHRILAKAWEFWPHRQTPPVHQHPLAVEKA